MLIAADVNLQSSRADDSLRSRVQTCDYDCDLLAAVCDMTMSDAAITTSASSLRSEDIKGYMSTVKRVTIQCNASWLCWAKLKERLVSDKAVVVG